MLMLSRLFQSVHGVYVSCRATYSVRRVRGCSRSHLLYSMRLLRFWAPARGQAATHAAYELGSAQGSHPVGPDSHGRPMPLSSAERHGPAMAICISAIWNLFPELLELFPELFIFTKVEEYNYSPIKGVGNRIVPCLKGREYNNWGELLQLL